MMTSRTMAPIMTLAVAALAIAACGGSSSSSSCIMNGVDCSDTNGADSGMKTVDTNAKVSFDFATKTYTAVGTEGTYTFTDNYSGEGVSLTNYSGTAYRRTINGNIYNLAFARSPKSEFIGFGGIGSSGVFLGQSGTTSAPKVQDGKMSYKGRYYASPTVGGGAVQSLTLDVDFGAGTVNNSGGSLGINGTISGTAVTGTATFNGNSGYLKGGFYGGNELNGVATDEKNFVAVFTTTQQ